MVLHKFHGLGPDGWPDFPERLAAGTTTFFLVVVLFAGQRDALAFWSGILRYLRRLHYLHMS